MKSEKIIEVGFLSTLLFIGIFYAYLASKTAFLGEDEATYLSLGKQLSSLQYPLRDNLNNPITAPLFVPVLYASLFIVLGTSLSLAKMIVVGFGILTLLTVFLLGKKINIYVGVFSVFVLLLVTLFTHFMLISYVDVPIAFFSVFSLFLISKIDSKKSAILAGIIIGLSSFVKETGVFISLALFVYSFYVYIFLKDKNQFKLYMTTTIISFLIISTNVLTNLLHFNYPYFILLNIFFASPGQTGPNLAGMITPQLSSITDFANIFGWLPLIISIFSLIYIVLERNKIKIKSISFATFLFIIFMLNFIFLYSIGRAIAEPRYFIFIFPQLALISGFYLWKLKEHNKYFLILIIPLIILGLYSSIVTAVATSQTERFPQNYIDALEWLKSNTPQNSLIFTTYGGSVKYFAERNIIWSSIGESGEDLFKNMMITNNSTYIYNSLKRYNVSYILIWRGVLSQDYMIQGSNIAGVFTYNFLNLVISDNLHFNVTYQNQDNIILKVL